MKLIVAVLYYTLLIAVSQTSLYLVQLFAQEKLIMKINFLLQVSFIYSLDGERN